MNKFLNKNVLVTGGSSGIGLATAKKLVGLGANVWILARRPNLLQTAKAEIEKGIINPRQVIGSFAVDITDYEQLQSVLNPFIKEYGVPDYLVNSAGITHPGRFDEMDVKIFRWNMETNYFGMINVINTIIPGMIKRHSGHIINICSLAGIIGTYGYTAYGGSKFAITGFTDSLRLEMKPLGVKVSIVFPPDTETPQLEYDRKHQPEITRTINQTARAMSADAVADAIIKGINHGRYIITPGFDSTLIYFIKKQMGWIEYPLLDFMVKQAMKDINKKILVDS